jgi:predicted RNA-binding Zn-ribbon protein involved in translation (DUF1610 family)
MINSDEDNEALDFLKPFIGKKDTLKFYEDLSSYSHYVKSPIVEIKNIGWLDKAHEFKRGKTNDDFVNKLRKAIFNTYKNSYSCDIIVNELRGCYYECPVCGKHDLEISDGQRKFPLGSAELWLPDNKVQGHYFATFDLIIHYVEDHDYCPPQEFIDAVLALDLESDFNGQEIRDQLARKYAGR